MLWLVYQIYKLFLSLDVTTTIHNDVSTAIMSSILPSCTQSMCISSPTKPAEMTPGIMVIYFICINSGGGNYWKSGGYLAKFKWFSIAKLNFHE